MEATSRTTNEEFLNEAFGPEATEMIITSHVVNDDNAEWETEAGNDTEDRIFLLSLDEADKYFADDESRIASCTAYALAQAGFKTDGDTDDTEGYNWWLRSPGSSEKYIAKVNYNGKIDPYGFPNMPAIGAVRPALWINIG
ncbi:MAG: hypothetical protein HUJ76_07785 [Parasporobacterium sp.]|nr:hypothetical protein [Parasporobacterium sp.]